VADPRRNVKKFEGNKIRTTRANRSGFVFWLIRTAMGGRQVEHFLRGLQSYRRWNCRGRFGPERERLLRETFPTLRLLQGTDHGRCMCAVSSSAFYTRAAATCARRVPLANDLHEAHLRFRSWETVFVDW
jgi:hypothetical protein